MTDHTVFYSEPMLLRFDSYEGRVAKGRLKTLRYQTVFSFDSMDQLFMIMDDVLDAGGFPRGQSLRYLRTEEGEAEEKENGLGKPAYVFWKLGPADRDPENDKRAETGGFHGQMTVTVCRREEVSGYLLVKKQ